MLLLPGNHVEWNGIIIIESVHENCFKYICLPIFPSRRVVISILVGWWLTLRNSESLKNYRQNLLPRTTNRRVLAASEQIMKALLLPTSVGFATVSRK